MFAIVATVQYKPEKMDVVRALALELTVPKLKSIKGFKSAQSATDPITGHNTFMILFETAEARASYRQDTAFHEQLRARVEPLLQGPVVSVDRDRVFQF